MGRSKAGNPIPGIRFPYGRNLWKLSALRVFGKIPFKCIPNIHRELTKKYIII